MRPTSTTDPTTRSTRQTRIAEKGNISRGKYTFCTRFELPVNERIEKRSDDAKKFQARKPQYAKSGYGTGVSIRATLVKMTEKTAVFTSGMKIAQANPITVCL